MPILNFQVAPIGQSGQFPKFIYIDTNDDPAEVETAGYLNKLFAEGMPLVRNDMALVSTGSTPATRSVSLYVLSFALGNWKLTEYGAGSGGAPKFGLGGNADLDGTILNSAFGTTNNEPMFFIVNDVDYLTVADTPSGVNAAWGNLRSFSVNSNLEIVLSSPRIELDTAGGLLQFTGNPSVSPAGLFNLLVDPVTGNVSYSNTINTGGLPPGSPNLGTSSTYGVLSKTALTTVNPTTINGDLGESPGSTVTGSFVVSGATNVANAAAAQAQVDANAAYVAIAALPGYVIIPNILDGQTITGGGNRTFAAGAVSLAQAGPGVLTISGSATDVFVFKTPSTLTTGAGGLPTINLIGGALASNVYWVIGSSATLNVGVTSAGATFPGTILAAVSITVTQIGTINGRLLATTASGAAISFSASAVVNVPGAAPPVVNSWLVGGNTLVATGYLGSLNAQAMDIGTNGTNVISINASGSSLSIASNVSVTSLAVGNASAVSTINAVNLSLPGIPAAIGGERILMIDPVTFRLRISP